MSTPPHAQRGDERALRDRGVDRRGPPCACAVPACVTRRGQQTHLNIRHTHDRSSRQEMTVTTPSEQPHHPRENVPDPQPRTDPSTEGSRRTFFTAAAGAFIGRFFAEAATDARRAMWPRLEDWL